MIGLGWRPGRYAGLAPPCSAPSNGSRHRSDSDSTPPPLPGNTTPGWRSAGASRPLIINVTERVAIDLEPTSLVIDNRPGEPVTKSVTITNRGNLPVVIGDIGAVPLDDEQKECRILRRAAEALDTEDPVTVDRLVEAIARAAKRVLDESGLLRVRNLTGTTELAPGQTMRLDLQIDLPTTLDPHTRYRGLVPIVTRDLQFVVVPFRVGGAPEKIPEKKTRSGARSAQAQTHDFPPHHHHAHHDPPHGVRARRSEMPHDTEHSTRHHHHEGGPSRSRDVHCGHHAGQFDGRGDGRLRRHPCITRDQQASPPAAPVQPVAQASLRVRGGALPWMLGLLLSLRVLCRRC